MNTTQALVSRVINYSCVDGPGNRMVVFMQGCNFNCTACHNPHTIGQCNHCGDCVDVCMSGALSLDDDGKVRYDPEVCHHCDACINICPISASPMAETLAVTDIVERVKKHKPFLSGITVSGGEATYQLEFLVELFTAIKRDPDLQSITCFIDSNGYLDAAGWEKVLPVTDGVMLDVKAFNDRLHKNLTGKSNERSLQSARLIRAAGKLEELRFLLIPGKTDSPAEIGSLIRFVTDLGKDTKLRLNAFQHHGVRGRALDWDKMLEPGVESVAAKLRAAGINNIVTPAVYV